MKDGNNRSNSVQLQALVNRLQVQQDAPSRFTGTSEDLGWGAIFGGQVLGQGLSAATQTVPHDCMPHSLHAYFLRPGNVHQNVEYHVEELRDGRSFYTRRVTASQQSKVILSLSASFHGSEYGFEHHASMPQAPSPDSLRPSEELVRSIHAKLPARLKGSVLTPTAIDIRPVKPLDPFSPTATEPRRMVWFRTKHKVPNAPSLHQILLAYVSDFSFLTTALMPHATSWLNPSIRMASLDHAIWFHRPFRIDQWLLHVMESTSAFGARGFVRGQCFNRAGELVASTSQEGLIRMSEWRDVP